MVAIGTNWVFSTFPHRQYVQVECLARIPVRAAAPSCLRVVTHDSVLQSALLGSLGHTQGAQRTLPPGLPEPTFLGPESVLASARPAGLCHMSVVLPTPGTQHKLDDDYRTEYKAQALPSAALPLGWAPRSPAGLPSRPGDR